MTHFVTFRVFLGVFTDSCVSRRDARATGKADWLNKMTFLSLGSSTKDEWGSNWEKKQKKQKDLKTAFVKRGSS